MPSHKGLLGVVLLSAQALGHTLMQHPIPFPSQLLDNGPMAKDGSNWPCSGDTEYSRDGVINVWERGSIQELRAMGGASHGGGSCQISITDDLKPTRKSKWRVIHSIQGGCPVRNVTEDNYGASPTVLLPSAYEFRIPDWVPLGPATMAWTWYGRWSVPEMFMNCAPIMVLGGEAGKDVTDPARRQSWLAAPLVFEANNGNGCWTTNKGSCLKFPDPGDSLVVNDECPVMEDDMLEGTCGPEYSLGNMGWGLGGGLFGLDALSVGLVAAVVVVLLVLVRSLRRVRRRYEKIGV